MDRKGVRSTVAVTAEEVKAALGKTRTLTSEEEKVVRMRHGAGSDLRAPLPQAAGGNQELKDELLVLEMQLLKAYRQHLGQAKAKANKPVNVVATSASDSAGARAKGKIVRALRKKR
jgi:hypothetical protein